MTWLKLIANAAWAGIYGAVLIALLIAYLNTDLAARGILSATFASVAASALIVHGPTLALLLTALFMILRFFAVRRLTAKWFSLKSTVWFGAATLFALTFVVYYNVRWSASLLPPDTIRALRVVAAAMAGCAVLGLAVACVGQFQQGEAARRVRLLAAFVLLIPMGLMPALLPRDPQVGDPAPRAGGPGEAPPRGAGPRVLIVGIDAASMDQLLPMISARRLPAFEALTRDGASARLNSIRPCVPQVAWTVLLTGTPPWRSGIRATREWSLPLGRASVQILPRGLALAAVPGFEARPVPDARRHAATLLEILEATGRPVHAPGWNGAGETPPVPQAAIDEGVEAVLGEVPRGLDGEAAVHYEALREALARDMGVHRAALAALSGPPDDGVVVGARLGGLAIVARHFLRHHEPEAFGDVRPDERGAFGRAITGYYEFLDALIAEQIATAGGGAIVVVASAHGVEPIPAPERLTRFLLRGASGIDPLASGSWRSGPDGVLFLRGPGIARATRMEEADLADVAPTLLFTLGLPIGRDMTGNLVRRVFEPSFLATHTVQYIPAWPRGAAAHPAPEAPSR